MTELQQKCIWFGFVYLQDSYCAGVVLFLTGRMILWPHFAIPGADGPGLGWRLAFAVVGIPKLGGVRDRNGSDVLQYGLAR